MSNESPYSPEKTGDAIFVAVLIAVALGLAGLGIWGLIALFTTHPVAGFLLVTGLVSFAGLVLLIQWLDDKYGWFDLGNW